MPRRIFAVITVVLNDISFIACDHARPFPPAGFTGLFFLARALQSVPLVVA